MATLALDCSLTMGGFALTLDRPLPIDGITALFGPSGAGKSTALRVVAGLERRAEGRVAFGGQMWQDSAQGLFVPCHRRGVGYVFQDARLFPHLSVAGNLRFAERRARRANSAIRYTDVVDVLELAPLLSRAPASLSGGERQRAAIARALLARPGLLLMDEPLSALDLARRAEILAYVERLPRAFGVPILYVTHAIDEVARLARRMVLLSAGRIVAAGATGDMLDRLDLRPLTGRFEAGSLLEAEIVRHEPGHALTVLAVAKQELRMPALDLAAGERIRLRVRARDVALATARPTGLSIRNVLDARVLRVDEEHETAFAEILLDLGGPHLRARITRAAVQELALAPGRPVYALVKSVALDRRMLQARPRDGGEDVVRGEDAEVDLP